MRKFYTYNFREETIFDTFFHNRSEACPFEFGLRKFALDLALVIFSAFLKKITSGGLIMYLGEFDFSSNIYVVKITST